MLITHPYHSHKGLNRSGAVVFFAGIGDGVEIGLDDGEGFAGFDDLAGADESRPDARAEHIEFGFDSKHGGIFGNESEGSVAGSGVQQHGHAAAVEITMLLGKLFAVGQVDFAHAGFNLGQDGANKCHKRLSAKAILAADLVVGVLGLPHGEEYSFYKRFDSAVEERTVLSFIWN